MGVNFYGWELSAARPPEAVLGSRYRELLQLDNARLQWDAAAAEHMLSYRDNGDARQLCYPSLKSLHQRLAAVKDSDAGISIWELGQGLEYFFDLL